MTNVKTGWNADDMNEAMKMGFTLVHGRVNPIRYGNGNGWAIRKYRYSSDPVANQEAFTMVMTQALAGDALCYKAMRIVCKTNPAYESYKPMVREVRKKYGW